ncbi:MAG: flavin reductase family protein [Gemmatimonadaceae bacterium]|nr:flavin reductase family protein [Gemmatimonadaceae bacterium]
MSVAAAAFRRALGAAPSPVTVVTVVDPHGADHGMTVSAFTSVSLRPPLVLVCIGEAATIAAPMRHAAHFGVSVLGEGQEALSLLFADRNARGFDAIPHRRGPDGSILLDGAAAHLECRVVARHPAGDHTAIVGEVTYARATGERPLVHLQGRYTAVTPLPD